jgi:hypothetical protein
MLSENRLTMTTAPVAQKSDETRCGVDVTHVHAQAVHDEVALGHLQALAVALRKRTFHRAALRSELRAHHSADNSGTLCTRYLVDMLHHTQTNLRCVSRELAGAMMSPLLISTANPEVSPSVGATAIVRTVM